MLYRTSPQRQRAVSQPRLFTNPNPPALQAGQKRSLSPCWSKPAPSVSFSPSPFRAIVTKEEDHDIDPDPKGGALGPAWASDWALTSAAVAKLGPGWYFVVRGGEVSYEVVVETR